VFARSREDEGGAPNIDCRSMEGHVSTLNQAQRSRQTPQSHLPANVIRKLGDLYRATPWMYKEPSHLINPQAVAIVVSEETSKWLPGSLLPLEHRLSSR
jgi:hypothetical protein